MEHTAAEQQLRPALTADGFDLREGEATERVIVTKAGFDTAAGGGPGGKSR